MLDVSSSSVLLRNLLLFMPLGLHSLLLGMPRRALKQCPLHLWLTTLLNHAVLNLFIGEGDQDQAGAVLRFCNATSLFFKLNYIHPDDWALHDRPLLVTCILLCVPCL